MPSLEDFRDKLNTDADTAFREYVLLIDCASLDYSGPQGQEVQAEFKRVGVVFEYTPENIIRMRAKNGSDAGGQEIAYLPWKNAASGGVSKVTLDGDGPSYFSTSQLDGCRFTLQYHGADRKKVTVQHLAGDLGGPSVKTGSTARTALEAQNLLASPDAPRPRRFSIGEGPGKMGKAGQALRAANPETTYYDGGKAAVFGYRNNQGAWVFYGAEIDNRSGQGRGLKNLGTGATATGPINTDAQRSTV
jgi:hypothetical protein